MDQTFFVFCIIERKFLLEHGIPNSYYIVLKLQYFIGRRRNCKTRGLERTERKKESEKERKERKKERKNERKQIFKTTPLDSSY
jgi:hypothetical protein